MEVEDTYLRLDRDLAAFFVYLDKQIGKGNYTVFLTADHGAAHNPQLLMDKNIPAGFLDGKQALKDLNTLLETKYGIPSLVLSFINYQVNLNNILISKNNLKEDEIIADCIRFLKTWPGIAYVINMKDAQATTMPDVLRQRIENGYHSERCGAIEIVTKPGWYQWYGNTGTTHGSPYPYDTHIPLLFMGWGVNQGKSNKQHYMTDITPTVSALLRIQTPSGSVGKVITDVLK